MVNTLFLQWLWMTAAIDRAFRSTNHHDRYQITNLHIEDQFEAVENIGVDQVVAIAEATDDSDVSYI